MDVLSEIQNENILEIRGLRVYNKYRKEQLLLDNLNISIRRGSYTALVGRSGAGKSITIRTILGLLDPDSWFFEGNIDFYLKHPALHDLPSQEIIAAEKIEILSNGKYNLENLKRIRGKGIFSIFQGPDTHLNPSLKIGWQIGEMLNPADPLKNMDEVKIRLESVGLSASYYEKYPYQLSQGQKQRVLISMALGGADLVIADEPTSSLDSATKHSIIDLFRNLRLTSAINSLLLITHDLEALKGLLIPSDTIYVLDYSSSGTISIVNICTLEEILAEGEDVPRILKPLNLIPQNLADEPLAEMPLLEIENLFQTHRQGFFKKDKEILKGINLKIFKGETIGIVGDSGCGKTTFIKSILRLWNDTRGKVILNFNNSGEEKDLVKIQPDGLKPDCRQMQEIRRNMQVIFQNSASVFNNKMMIYEILCETLKCRGITDKSTVSELLAEKLIQFNICKKDIDVNQILAKYPWELSGGEKQRLAILRVFLLEPEIIIADEPFAEQDLITTAQIIEMFRSINQTGSTIIIISHDLSIIKSLCSRILTLRDGLLINDEITESKDASIQTSDQISEGNTE